MACQADPLNATGYCPAVNDDWDALRSTGEVAAFTNPVALAAVVGLRRDRVNIVTFDHYTPAITETRRGGRSNQSARPRPRGRCVPRHRCAGSRADTAFRIRKYSDVS